jgi:hypothetical protein
MLKIYTLPNHTITIGVFILETQLSSLLYGCGAIVSDGNGPCRGCQLIYSIAPFSIKGTLTRDFRPLVFFIKQLPLGS